MLEKDEETPKTNGAAPNGHHEQPPASELPDSDDDRPWRGVFALTPEREELFSMEIDVTNLPRWEPHIYIDQRRIADDDE